MQPIKKPVMETDSFIGTPPLQKFTHNSSKKVDAGERY
jgi:hypothetical protein